MKVLFTILVESEAYALRNVTEVPPAKRFIVELDMGYDAGSSAKFAKTDYSNSAKPALSCLLESFSLVIKIEDLAIVE